jgi:dihydropteroate synthase
VTLRARQFMFAFPRRTLVMGIVNVTPDSFSDGGRFVDTAAAVAHALRLEAEGAEILDIGGESTRPGALPVTEEEELRRVVPVIEALAGRVKAPLSVDTMKPGVARAALEAGAAMVNDVAANRLDEAMWRVVAQTGAAYVCLHMQGTPQTMQHNPVYGDVVEEVADFFSGRIQRLLVCGVDLDQIILDPGIGFGKTFEHNLELLGGLGRFTAFGRPVLIGVSRKSFIGRVSGGNPQERLAGGLACACLAVKAGANIVRAHEVAQTAQALRMTEAIVAKKRVT